MVDFYQEAISDEVVAGVNDVELSKVSEVCLDLLEKCKHSEYWYETIYSCTAIPFVCAPAAVVDGTHNIHKATKEKDGFLVNN